jgi:hypothetical protein
MRGVIVGSEMPRLSLPISSLVCLT